MLFFAISIAYIISSIRISLCVLIICISSFVVLSVFGITPLQIINNYKDLIFGILFFGAFIPFIYGILDIVYGFTCKYAGKQYLSFEVYKSPPMMWIGVIAHRVATAMGSKNIVVCIEKSENPRIYSLGSLKKRRIYISTSLINYLTGKVNDLKERDHVVGALIAAEISNLENYSFLPMMILKGGDKIANILCIVATIPVRILFIPVFLMPIIRNAMVYVINFFTLIIKSIDKIFFSILFIIYQSLRYKIFDRKAENISDYQATQLASREIYIMALAILKDIQYSDNYFKHSSSIHRIKNIEKIRHAQDFENVNPVMRGMIFCCVVFTVSSIFAINAEIWLLPIFIMENLILLHHGLVIFFSLITHFKQMLGNLYQTFNI